MKRALLTMLTGFACLIATVAAECGPYHCDGEIPGQGPRCYCDVDGNLCGHDGFASCMECPTP